MRRKGISGTKDDKPGQDDSMRPPAESRSSLGGGSMLDNLAALIPSNAGAPPDAGSGSEGEWD